MTTPTTAPTPWLTDWDLDRPITLKGARTDAGDGEWTAGPTPYFEYRSLRVDEASDGKFSGWHVRRASEGGDWQADDVDFQLLFVLKGTASIAFAGGKTVELRAESAVTIPALYRYRMSGISDDFEALQIAAPAAYDIVWGEDAPLPERAGTLDPDRAPVYNHDEPEEYGSGLRAFFKYRDLGTRAPSGGRVYTHIVHAQGTPFEAGTGWHYHSWAQWFVVIGGNADIRVETSARHRLGYGDSYCIGAGPTQRHFVDRVSGDYKVFEVCIPGWQDSTPVDAPEGAAD